MRFLTRMKEKCKIPPVQILTIVNGIINIVTNYEDVNHRPSLNNEMNSSESLIRYASYGKA